MQARLESIRHWIKGLHGGQVVIIVAVGAACALGLLLLRSKAAGHGRFANYLISGATRQIDSLCNPLICDRDSLFYRDRRANRRLIELEDLIDEEKVERTEATIKVVALDLAISVIGGLSILFVPWVWFGGRQRASTE